MKNFIQMCRDGKASPDQIDDFIGRWHKGGCKLSLHECLGMSWEEYAEWVEDPNFLKELIKVKIYENHI